jgi:hypothetical protein
MSLRANMYNMLCGGKVQKHTLIDIVLLRNMQGLAHLPKPSWWLNGMLNAIPDGGAAAVDQELGYAIMGEMQLLQEHIYFGRIDGDEPVRTRAEQFVA